MVECSYCEGRAKQRIVGLWALRKQRRAGKFLAIQTRVVILISANRYIRRFKNVSTVGQWNELIHRIGAGFPEYARSGLSDILISGRDKAPLVWGNHTSAWNQVPHCRYTKKQIWKRYSRMREQQNARISTEPQSLVAQLRCDIAEAKRDIAAIRKAIKETSAALSRISP